MAIHKAPAENSDQTARIHCSVYLLLNTGLTLNKYSLTYSLGQAFSLRVRKITEKKMSYFSIKTYVVGTQKNRHNETVLLSTQKHMLKIVDKKIFTILR